jgi:DNA-binding GntR family transcriptional regulator
LVDGAERALRGWLAPGRYREGDRLPPEHELASMLKVSRGTLRSALHRLEVGGEIVRRQGSGTFVGNVSAPGAFGEQLQRLEGYASYARRHGMKLTATHLRIELRETDEEAAEHLALEPRTRTVSVSRVMLSEGQPVAAMYDVFHPDVLVPEAPELRRRLREGEGILEVLKSAAAGVSFSRSLIAPVMALPTGPLGRRLKLAEPTACLQLSEIIFAVGERPLLYSRDVFTPGGIEVEFTRSVDRPQPPPVSTTPANGRRTAHG